MSVDQLGFTDVYADRETTEFVRAQGGNVYAWLRPTGGITASLERPPDIDFIEMRARGFRLLQDARLHTPSTDLGWRVTLRRWPRRRVTVDYGGDQRGSRSLLDALTDLLPW